MDERERVDRVGTLAGLADAWNRASPKPSRIFVAAHRQVEAVDWLRRTLGPDITGPLIGGGTGRTYVSTARSLQGVHPREGEQILIALVDGCRDRADWPRIHAEIEVLVATAPENSVFVEDEAGRWIYRRT